MNHASSPTTTDALDRQLRAGRARSAKPGRTTHRPTAIWGHRCSPSNKRSVKDRFPEAPIQERLRDTKRCGRIILREKRRRLQCDRIAVPVNIDGRCPTKVSWHQRDARRRRRNRTGNRRQRLSSLVRTSVVWHPDHRAPRGPVREISLFFLRKTRRSPLASNNP